MDYLNVPVGAAGAVVLVWTAPGCGALVCVVLDCVVLACVVLGFVAAFSSLTLVPSLIVGSALYGPMMILSPTFNPEVITVWVMSLASMDTGVMTALPSTTLNTTVAQVLFLSTSGLLLADSGSSSIGRPITACVGTLITPLWTLVSISTSALSPAGMRLPLVSSTTLALYHLPWLPPPPPPPMLPMPRCSAVSRPTLRTTPSNISSAKAAMRTLAFCPSCTDETLVSSICASTCISERSDTSMM